MKKIDGAGDLPMNVIFIHFPSAAQAREFFADPDYQPLRSLRLHGAHSESTLFPAEDLAETFQPPDIGVH